MNRRGPALALIAFLALVGAVQAQPPPIEGGAKLAERIDGLLRAELTQHWYPHALDKELGGFHQTFARDWSPLPDENRFLVYQARMTWTAAAFALYSKEHHDEYVEYARRGVEYLDQVMRDREFDGFYFEVDPKGRADSRDGEKHVYATAFVLYAASRALRANGKLDLRVWQLANDAFDWLEENAHDEKNGGYFEAIHRDGRPILDWDAAAPKERRTDRLGVYYGFKSMNSHIHLLEALTEFARIRNDPRVMQRLKEVLAIVRDKIAVAPGALNLYLTADWRAVPAHDSFGHDIETAYLLVEAAIQLGGPELSKTKRVARSLVDHALDWGWDDEHGGFYDKGEVFNGEAFARNKVWWTQAEGLNALLLMHELYGKRTDRYAKAFLKQWGFIEKHMIDPEHGGWYMETTREGKLVGDGRKATQWKANYHTSRALMNVATKLREWK